MAIAVASFFQSTPADSATHTVTKPTGTADGELLIVAGSIDQDGAAASLTAPAGWTLVHSGGSGGAASGQAGFFRVWTRIASGEGASWTFGSSAASNSQFTALRITGAAGALINVTAAGGTVSKLTTHVAPTVTAQAAGDLLICGWQIIAQMSASTYVAPGGMTQAGVATSLSGTWLRHLVAYEVLGAAGATGTRTMTTSLTPATWGDTTWSVTLSFPPAPGVVAAVGAVPAALAKVPAKPAVVAAVGIPRAAIAKTGPQGNVVAAVAGVPHPVRPKMATFTDTFTTADADKWIGAGGANPTIVSGQLNIVPDPGYSSFFSARSYDLTSSSLTIQAVQMPNVGNGTTQAFVIQARLDSGNLVQWLWGNGTIIADYVINGGGVAAYSAAFNSVTHAWLRITESGGTVSWDYSSDGTSWTNAGSVAIPWAMDLVSVYMAAGYYGTEPSPGTLILDNLNLPPSAPAPAVVAGVAGIPAANPSLSAIPAAPVVAATAAVPAPSIRRDITATPAVVAATAGIPAPTVRQDAAPAPAVVAAVAGVATPGVRHDETITAPVVAATAAVPAASIRRDVTATPGVVAATAGIPVPGVRRDVAVTAPVVAATAAIGAATAVTTDAALPAVVAATAAVPAVVVSLPATAAPAVVAATAAVPAVTFTSSAVPAPATVAAAASIPAPTGSGTVGVATVAAVVSVPTPTVVTVSVPVPAVVAATAAIPAPAVTGSSSATTTPAVVAALAAVPGATAVTVTVAAPATVAAIALIPAPRFTPQPGVVAAVARVGTPTVAARSRAGSVIGTRRRGPAVVAGMRTVGRLVGARQEGN